ncbi:MAG TPA: gamma-glutamyltransferase [Rhizobiaceae bacterium]|nr:gamma-glutamyltransferase [Rhizobiaceae bacterium]
MTGLLSARLSSTLLALLLAGSAPALSQQATDTVAPEASTPGLTSGDVPAPVQAKTWMVSAANPLAAQAGADVLAKGGNAIDAMIAVQLVLGLVEPQSSGLGGGAFLVYWDAATKKLTTLDGRETAPAAARPQLFLDDKGEPLDFIPAVIGGRSVGVPGTPRLLETVHRRWGKTAWPSLFTPAIALAENGFAVSPRLAGLLADDVDTLASHPATASYFMPGGTVLAAGASLKNPAYAATLKALALDGADAFYEGPLAGDIVATVRGAANAGVMQLSDLANYRVVEREPVCVAYRGRDVCGMGPPSSGAVAVGQILKLIEPFDIKTLGPDDPQSWRLIGDASRLAFADRDRYLADSDFVPVPLKGLLADDYLAPRAALLKTDKTLGEVTAGEPAWDHALLQADDESIELPSTSHFSIVDAEGNALSMTTTIESGFGSRLMVGGFLLNNELTDFSFRTHKDGVPIANRVEPGKRPRSSMSPTIVLENGTPRLIIGSPGGSQIIGYVAKTIIAHLDWGLDIQQSIALPNMVNRFGTFELEAGTAAAGFEKDLQALGFETEVKDLNSGLHGIAILPTGIEGGADPRREGVSIGE